MEEPTDRAGLQVVRILTSLVAAGLFLTACTPSPDAPEAAGADGLTEDTAGAPDPTWEPIEIALTLYLVDVDPATSSDADADISTERTEEELMTIAADMAAIWAQAGVVFEPLTIRRISIPAAVLNPIAASLNADRFFDQAGRTFEVPDPGAINGFYLAEAGGVNGFAPRNSRIFFVVDEPTVDDERVSSHEIGHILGLHHVLHDRTMLMFSGTNGTALSESEQYVARYGAQGILDNQR